MHDITLYITVSCSLYFSYAITDLFHIILSNVSVIIILNIKKLRKRRETLNVIVSPNKHNYAVKCKEGVVDWFAHGLDSVRQLCALIFPARSSFVYAC